LGLREPSHDSPSAGQSDPASSTSGNPATVAALPKEQAEALSAAGLGFQSSKLLPIKRAAPIAWLGLCALLIGVSLLGGIWSGISLLMGGKSSAMATAAPTATDGSDVQVTQQNTQQMDSVASSAGSKAGAAGSKLAGLAGWLKQSLFFALTMLLAPTTSVAIAGFEKRPSPLARSYRQLILAGGWADWLVWAIAGLMGLIAVHLLGLWLAVIAALIVGLAIGAGYYFGIEKPIAAARQPFIDQAQAAVKQLRLRGWEEPAIRRGSIAKWGGNWDELYESLFGYEALRLAKSDGSRVSLIGRLKDPGRYFRDRLIDGNEVKLAEKRRLREEQLLVSTEKAELLAAGVPEADAKIEAQAVAAAFVDAAAESRKVQQEIAQGNLTEQAAALKRQRIKTMLADARSGKGAKRAGRSGRAFEFLMNQLLGGKCRLVCAALLWLAVGFWVNANRQSLDSSWKQAAKTAASISTSNLKAVNTEALQQAASSVAELGQSSAWQPVLSGLVTQRNVAPAALAALVLSVSLFWSGWKKSLILIPLAAALLLGPLLL
jgi:hypothetical protein